MSFIDRAEAWLNTAEAKAAAATEGPWAAWLDQDGAEHMSGMLMVGNAAAVIPDGEIYIDGVDVNPIAHTYVPEDREFIAFTRSAFPQAVAALRAVLNLHRAIRVFNECDEPDCENEHFEVSEYMACEDTFTGWGCEHCCYPNDWPTEECPHEGIHDGLTDDKACPTVQAINEKLGET